MWRPPNERLRPCHAAALLTALFGAFALAASAALADGLPECSVPPRPASQFVLPTAAADAGEYFLIVDNELDLPTGTPAPATDVAEAEAFAAMYTACQNSGDLRRISALYTDAMFRASLAARMPVRLPPANPLEALLSVLTDPAARDAAEAATQLANDISAPPTPLSPPITEMEVRNVRVLPDGRLGAILVQDFRPTEFQIYTRVDGKLLLDQRITLRLIQPQATPELPDAPIALGGEQSECIIEPIGLPEVEATIAALPSEANSTNEFVSIDELPAGSPASPESVNAVVALEQEFAACLNQQDWPRVMALLTGSGMRTLLEGSDRSAAELMRSTPVPLSQDEAEWGMSGMMQIAEVRDVRVLDDGRLGAIVVWDDPESPGAWAETLFHTYERVGDRLLLDEEIVVSQP